MFVAAFSMGGQWLLAQNPKPILVARTTSGQQTEGITPVLL